MTGQREVTKYATPVLTVSQVDADRWYVRADPGIRIVGSVQQFPAGWTAITLTGRVLGLWPTKQAAAEVLVKQAGYELERS